MKDPAHRIPFGKMAACIPVRMLYIYDIHHGHGTGLMRRLRGVIPSKLPGQLLSHGYDWIQYIQRVAPDRPYKKSPYEKSLLDFILLTTIDHHLYSLSVILLNSNIQRLKNAQESLKRALKNFRQAYTARVFPYPDLNNNNNIIKAFEGSSNYGSYAQALPLRKSVNKTKRKGSVERGDDRESRRGSMGGRLPNKRLLVI